MTGAVLAARKPAYYYGWNIVFACILSQLCALGVPLNCFSLFLHGWTRDFHMPASDFVLGVTTFSFGCSIFTIPAGLAADKYPIRWVMGLGLVGMTLAHLAMGSARAGWQIIAVYSVLLPATITFSSAVPAQAVVSRWFVRRRGAAMGLCAFGLAMAGVIFPPIIAQLLPAIGWRATWLVFAGLIGLVIAPIVVFTLRDRPTAEEGATYVTAEPRDASAVKISFGQVFGRPNFWAILGVFLPVQFISMAASITMAPIALSRGFNLRTAALLLSIYSVSALSGKLSSGLIADRLGNRIPFAMVAAIAAGGVALLGVASNLPMFIGAVVMIGLSQGHWTLLASSTAAEFGPRAFGRAYGVISAFTPIGSIAPYVVARVFERSGDYSVSLYGLSLVALCGSAVALVTLRERSRPST